MWVGAKKTKDKGRSNDGCSGLNWCREETEEMEPQGNVDGSYWALLGWVRLSDGHWKERSWNACLYWTPQENPNLNVLLWLLGQVNGEQWKASGRIKPGERGNKRVGWGKSENGPPAQNWIQASISKRPWRTPPAARYTASRPRTTVCQGWRSQKGKGMGG